MHRLCAILVAAGAVSSAAAQCNVYRHAIPDLDQLRSGIPNNGSMYCAPASALNLLAYIANRGVPEVMLGARNWQSDANHAFVTNQLLTMGVMMGTDAVEGTSGGYVGLRNYLNAVAPGKFVVSQQYGDFDVFSLLYPFTTGGLVNICYGYYNRDQNGWYIRNGGHCVTLTGVINYCDPTYRLRWRNPISDDQNWSQSIFTNQSSSASSQTFQSFLTTYRKIRLWELGNDASRCYVDGVTVIAPRVAIRGSITSADVMVIQRAVVVAGLNAPASSPAVIPGGDAITQLAINADQTQAFAVTFDEAAHLYRVWRQNLADAAGAELLSAEVPIRVATSRFGELFVQFGSFVRKYTFVDGALTFVQQAQAPAAIDALAYDDTRDELVVVTANNRLVRFQNDLNAATFDFSLPANVVTNGEASLAIDEEAQKYYISGKDDPRIFVVRLMPGTPVPGFDSEILLPAVQRPECVQFTEEATLILLSDGFVHEFEIANGSWIPRKDSAFAGLPAAGALVVGRSRTSFKAGVHDAPGWNNVVVDENLPEEPDCTADFNLDGAVSSQDFFDFLGAFFASDLTSDFNFDGVVSSQDFFGFLTAFFIGCI